MRNPIRAGLTLVEITIAMAIFGSIASIAGQSMISGTRMSEEISVASRVTDDTNRVLQRIAGQLRSADYSWIYMNEGEVSTYTFKVCTGLGVSDTGEIGPQFNQTYTIAFDSINGVLTATLADQTTGRLINQEIARNLRKPDGFRVNQLGTDVLVKGNQLQLAMARSGYLGDGTEVMREATTTIFLRSTIYANTNLTTTITSTVTLPVGTTPTTPTTTTTTTTPNTPTIVPVPPLILLGADTDTTQKVIDKKLAIYGNNLLIKGTVQMPSGTSDSINYNTFDLRLSKASNGVDCSATVVRGWIASENRAGKLAANEFLVEGWVQGSLTITVVLSSTGGAPGTATKTY